MANEDATSERPALERQRASIQARLAVFKARVREIHGTQGEAEASTSEENGGGSLLNGIKLPTIDLPKFDGAYEHWLEFRDTYKSLIHENKTINNIQKFHYLRASLVGTAKQAIRSLDFTSNNYQVAWDVLCKRFNNMRLLVHNHVKSLFRLDVIVKESFLKIRALIDSVLKHLTALSALNQPTDKWDTLVIYIIGSKLDETTTREWEHSKIGSDLPTLDDLIEFLRCRADFLETIQAGQMEKAGFQKQNKPNAHTFFSTKEICVFCKGEHRAHECSDFLKLSSSDRHDQVKAAHLCFNCLKKRHFGRSCKSGPCKKCKGRHHTLLHFERESANSAPTTSVETVSGPDAPQVALSSINVMNKQVLLSTAYVKVTDTNRQTHHVRALLDSGSQSSFITLELCKRLNLATERANISVAGLNNAVSRIEYKCDVKMQSLQNAHSVNIVCYVLKEITGELPNRLVDTSKITLPRNIKLADPTFYKPGKIDILIGADWFWNLICIGQINLGRDMPILQKTRFGWVISGPIQSQQQTRLSCNFSATMEIQDQLARFWQIEECPPITPLSAEEHACETIFQTTTKRTTEGRFIVSIPWKDSVERLGESKGRACKRFYSLEKKLQSNSELRTEYVKFMEEYATMGHMSEVADKDDSSQAAYYMPHHGVIRKGSLTTKLRVVFDGSAPTTSGLSLNDIQMVGPVIQQDLFSIVLRFRQHMYVASADIAKMYRQVLIEPKQRQFQRIVWRSDPLQTLKTYELNTVTYGTAAASFLAIRCLHELARKCEGTAPAIAKIIREDFYVDDLITGAKSVEELSFICREVSAVLKEGRFDLRKWISNEPRVVQELGDSNLPVNILDLGPHENTRTLGLNWSSQTDSLIYSIKMANQSKAVTKRAILSDVAQIFDPLGLLSPCVITAKILLQKLWYENLSWDESLPTNLHSQWLKFKDELAKINEIRIPRRVLCEKPVIIELHGFSDASEAAYGGCIYLRSIDKNREVLVRLLCAKSKVAPLKTVTIPRLELCGALVLARLIKKVQTALNLTYDKCVLWCDSTIVLNWLKTSPSLLKPFVGNRVAEIQSLTEPTNWRHVPTNDNPADFLSRGIEPHLIKQCNIWWHGPQWLAAGESHWPTTILLLEDLPELRAKVQSFQVTRIKSLDLHRYSDLNKLQRIIAYCLRFKYNCFSAPGHRKSGPISASESQHALIHLVKLAQLESFPREISNLKRHEALSTKSKLLSLNPFVDNYGLLRVGGRLANSEFNNDKMHPIILDGRSHLMKLIFRREHSRLLHPGAQLLLASIREKFWPISGRNVAKGIVRECMRCFRANPKPSSTIMGNLPKNRVTATHPFSDTGVDYGGPFTIKDRKGRGCKTSKCYLCLFVCFSTKAIHLELVTDLTKDAFILALRRFVSRRGKPANIYSDNGTNFVGANSEIETLGTFLRNNETDLAESYASENINWHFIPAHSPHFGGLWEAGVKSTKHHLKRVIGNALLTYEELATVLVQIEAVLNSRPLSPLSSDPKDPNPLTPAHFLIGRSLISLPDPDVTELPENRLSIYQRLQQMVQHFWNRWSKEYISELQQRSKWKQQTSNIKEGSMVVIKEENLPPMRWLIGRVLQLHPGSDGVVRVVTIKTLNAQLKRAVAKVCVLPIDEQGIN